MFKKLNIKSCLWQPKVQKPFIKAMHNNNYTTTIATIHLVSNCQSQLEANRVYKDFAFYVQQQMSSRSEM